MRIVITGATGFVGYPLGKQLLAQGHEVVILTRQPLRALELFPSATIASYPTTDRVEDWQCLVGCDGVINLAGRAIADAWNPQVKKEILDSRVDTTRRLVNALQLLDPKPAVMISASAIGFYGTSLTETFTESSPGGKDFLATVCQQWEAEADRCSAWGIRSVKIRLGIVLAKGGGALAKMMPIFQLGLGGKIGTGSQWFSWIHRDDLIALILYLLEHPHLTGVFNGTAPHPVTNQEFTETLGKALSRPAILPVPDLVLKLALGEGAVVLLEGQKVIPTKTIESGFTYRYPALASALTDIVG